MKWYFGFGLLAVKVEPTHHDLQTEIYTPGFQNRYAKNVSTVWVFVSTPITPRRQTGREVHYHRRREAWLAISGLSLTSCATLNKLTAPSGLCLSPVKHVAEDSEGHMSLKRLSPSKLSPSFGMFYRACGNPSVS